MKNTKIFRFGVLMLSLCLMLSISSAALAIDDILSIDGKTGSIWVEGDPDGYNYAAKYLYDVTFAYTQKEGNPTLAEVIEFLSTGRQEGFAPRVDLYSYINSAMGEKTAEIWYPYMVWSGKPMDEGLLDYWLDRGLLKEQFLANEEIPTDYYVYSPVDAKESGESHALIVIFHGGGEPAHQAETFGFCQLAVDENLILVAAENTGDNEATRKIIETVSEAYPVDTSRVYIVGSSGGGSNALRFSVANADLIAACAIMDQPAALANRWWNASDEEIASIQNYNLPLLFVGGTADMYGLHGIQDREFFSTSEGAEPQFITGWNTLMAAYGIEGKDLTEELRYALADNPSNKAEELDGYPFDNAVNLDTTGTSPAWLCTMDANPNIQLIIVENRAHMPTGGDAENILNFFRNYSCDENGVSVLAE